MNEEEPLNEYKETHLKFNTTGKPITGTPSFDQIRNDIKKLCDEIDSWLSDENK